MLYWVNVYTNFEYKDNQFFDFKKCEECRKDENFNFSSNALMRGLPFNIFFGMLIGIYLSNRNFLNIRIQWKSLTCLQKCIKIFIYLSILSLEIFAFFPYFEGFRYNKYNSLGQHYLTRFIQNFIVSFVVGYLLTTVYFDLHECFQIPFLKPRNKGRYFVAELSVMKETGSNVDSEKNE